MEDHRPRCLALVAFVALAALTAAPASAQGNRPVTIAPASAEANVTEGSPALFDLHLSSADALLPHAARLVLDGPPAGWTYRFTPAVVNLSAGGEANATLVLYPPASAVAGDVVNFTFHAVEDGPTSIPLSGDVAVSVSILPPPPPPPPERPAPPKLDLVARESEGPAGQSVKGLVTIYNADVRALTVTLSAVAPAGWSANVAVPSTRVLQPDALAQVEVFARAPPEAAEGVRAIPILARVDGSDVVFRATWNVTVLPPLPQPEPDPQPEPEPTRTGEDPGVVPPGERPADAPAVAVSLGESALAVGPGESVSTVLRVENTGNVALALAVSGSVPEGWSPLAFEAASFDLAPGAARDVRVTLSAPSDAVPDPRGTGHGSVVVTSASGLLRSLPYTVRVVPAAPRDASTSTSAPAATLDGDAAPVSGFAVGVAVGVGTVGAGALALSSRPLREKLLWLGVGLYTRLARPDVLGHEERDRLYKMIESRPGVHFHALQRDLAWNTGTLTYHLRVLERHGFVVSRRDGLYRRFYLSGAAPRKETFNQGPQGLRADVLEAVRGQPGISQSDLALALGQNKQTVNYHVKALERQGALRIEKRGRDTYLYPVLPGDVPAQPGAA